MSVSPMDFPESIQDKELCAYLGDCERLYVIQKTGGHLVYDRVRTLIKATYDTCVAMSKDEGLKKI